MFIHQRLHGVLTSGIAILVAGIFTAGVVGGPQRHVSAESEFPNSYQEKVISLRGRVYLSASDVKKAMRAARNAGADAYAIRVPMLSMVMYSRVNPDDETAPPRPDSGVVRRGWRVPMQAVAMPVALVRRVGGDQLAEVVEHGEIVMGESSARIRNAQVGDVVTVLNHRNKRMSYVVGAIVSDTFTSGGDLLVSDVIADQLGARAVRRVVFVGFRSESQIRRSVARQGFRLGSMHEIARSWGPRDPDAALEFAKVKEMFGEFSFRRVNKQGILVEPLWRSRNIVHRITYSDIRLNHNCHRKVISAIQDALTEIRAQGLENEIDLENSNRYGGCYVGRVSRLARDSFGPISRHAWGIAFDINTTTNAQGRAPQMNCDVVRIFRKHGFSWGGNYLMPDGMHFEYVGEPRHEMKYPSRYCPN
jgi:hypothetical protein